MYEVSKARGICLRLISFFTMVSLIAVATAFAQTAQRKYDVELAVSQGKKSVQTDADIIFNEMEFQVIPDKTSFKSSTKNIAYTDVKTADHSFAKKPMLSGGGAVATALLVGFIFALPFLFIKKKKHWMTIRTENDFAVMQLGDGSFRQVVAEFETHGVKVNDLGDESKKK